MSLGLKVISIKIISKVVIWYKNSITETFSRANVASLKSYYLDIKPRQKCLPENWGSLSAAISHLLLQKIREYSNFFWAKNCSCSCFVWRQLWLAANPWLSLPFKFPLSASLKIPSDLTAMRFLCTKVKFYRHFERRHVQENDTHRNDKLLNGNVQQNTIFFTLCLTRQFA